MHNVFRYFNTNIEIEFHKVYKIPTQKLNDDMQL